MIVGPAVPRDVPKFSAPAVALPDDEKTALRHRLRRAEGQVAAVARMLDADAYCVDVLTQLRAATAALNKVGAAVLENHLRTCVADAFAAGDAADREAKIAELMGVFGKYGGK